MVPGARCMHVAPRCGPRWYNFTILISRDHISREGTIQTFLFHGLFLAIFLSIIPFCGSVTRTVTAQVDTVGKDPDPFWDWHTWSRGLVSWCHHSLGSDQDSISPVTGLMTRSPRQSNGNLTRPASKKRIHRIIMFRSSGLTHFLMCLLCRKVLRKHLEH